MGQFGRDLHLYGVVADLTLPLPVSPSVVARAADGDVDAFETIVGVYHDDMARIAYLITRDVELTQDAVQAAWPIAWRGLRGLREPQRLRQWLMAIAANEARQMMRRQRRHPVTELREVDAGSSDGDPGTRAGQIDLRAALARLSPEERSLLALRYVAGFDAMEIARTVGLSASGVRSRLSRLVAHLRTELIDG
jgi:RNA polymerase sigma factor (sigma-70 family)